ncbi:hypothetical protein QFC21_003625 [Naganishia friedmannii]|uniref:Uncharacterized protein n=1 Tax=Naganishia friedmannii TaxID=89922 RepID=A0ACC2VNA0_9TREE|nr:hypothetical protein QFC21_003625 [Naganishia friedmannii]
MAFDLAQSIDVGHLAKWAVSSHKYGFSVANLRDDNDDTFWQSEGPQPHWIDLAFPKRVMLSIRQYDLEKPNGWISIPLRPIIIDDPSLPAPLSTAENPMAGKIEVAGPPIPAFYIRVQILQNHLNGKDTHVRGLRVFGVSGTGIPLSQRVTLPILVSYSAANKPHDPRHPTSQTTAVTKRSILGHGAQIPYSTTKDAGGQRSVIPEATPSRKATPKEASLEGATRHDKSAPAAATSQTLTSLPYQRNDEEAPAPRADPTGISALSSTAPVQPQPTPRSARTAERKPHEAMDISGNDLSHDAGLDSNVDRDPLEDPLVQEALQIMEWGDDGLSGYTSVDFRMHRGIR